MRKTSSTGNLFDNSYKNKFSKISKKLSLKNNKSGIRKNKIIFASKVKNVGDNSHIFSSSTLSLNNRSNIFDNSLSNKQVIFSNDKNIQKKLYDELMLLKKKVNFLNAQIALEKSSKIKKDVQIINKTRQIKSYQSDIKMSKDITPINIDKLKNSNIISHLKKEFQTAKGNLNAKKTETKNMEAFLKKAKPNIIRQENLILEQKLKDLLKEYKDLLELNTINSRKINEMEGLHEIFVKNHEKIEQLRQRKETLEKNISFLQEDINVMNEANYRNDITLMKQNKNKMNYNRHIEHLMKEKKNKEEILKMKMTYKQQINKLEEEEKEYRDKYSNKEKQIKDLKENIYLVEKMLKIDPLKMKAFDYSKIKEMERNPNEVINSKILLLQSLITESINNKKKYQEIINTYIYRFNELGYDYTQLDKAPNELEKNNNDNNNNNDNAKNHKDVLSGRKTEEDVYGEFIETFETHHNIKKGVRDRRVTKEEFIEYYNNISMNIDDDDYFIEMMKNAWKLRNQPSYENQKGWSNKNENKDNRNVSDYYQSSNLNQKRGKMLGEKNPKVGTSANAPFGTDNLPTNYQTSNNPNYNYNRNQSNVGSSNKNKGDDVLNKFRNKMAARGTRGIMSIRRAFMIADDDNSKTVDLKEFKKFCHDYRIDLNEDEIEELFKKFDRDGSGHIDYEEFVYNTNGQMNDFRKNIVKKVFDKLDKNKNGTVELEDIRGIYNAKKHPDVLSGKKSEDEILAEFLDTFEYHFSLLNTNKSRDGKITLDEFIEYYNNISMSVPDDYYFEAIMNSAWDLDGRRQNYGRGRKGY